MKIIFNLMNTGLGNNGGSRTIIKSANTLQDLGHEVIIIDTGKNQNTWVPLKANHIRIKKESNIPNADAIIGTGFNTWNSTTNLPNRCGKKYVWVRGYETWVAPQEKLLNTLYDKRLTKIVNSICLQQKLKLYNIESCIIRPGNDFDEIYPLGIRKHDKFIIGGLYNFGGKRSTKRVDWMFDAIKELKKLYAGISFWMFGSDGFLQNDVVDKFWHNPSIELKNEIYNKCHIWLFPSELEGLSVVCQEAMLAECCVIGTSAPMSGTQDFLINNSTGLISDNDFKSFRNTIQKIINNPNLRKQYGINSRQLIIKLGDRKSNMKELVEILER